jgi:acetolactate synthase-1/2/3 large subunit
MVVSALASLGVQRVFGVPGGQTLAIMDAIRSEPRVTFIPVRHEGAAAVAADAHGRLTGTPGVCLATTGPGATNLLTGIGGALRDSSPVIAITCNNNGADLGKDDAQNADHVALFSPLVKSSRLIVDPRAIPQAIEEAYALAVSGNPGPVHLDFARDAIEGHGVSYAPPKTHPLAGWARQRPRGDATLTHEAARRLSQAHHPVLWLGSGAARSGAGDVALRLAGTLLIPVITTFNGIGSVPMSHPLVFGVESRMGTSLASAVLSDADLVLAVGNGLNAISTGRWRLALPDVIEVNIDPSALGRYYAAQTLGIVGDARAVLEDLVQQLCPAETLDAADPLAGVVAERGTWIARLQMLKDRWWEEVRGEVSGDPPGDPLAPPQVVTALRSAAPDETLLIADAGNVGVWSYLWETRGFNRYMKPVGFGNMGFAVPAAIAAALLDDRRPVLALVGDGSLGMTLAELETLGRVGGRVCIVTMNDAGYGNIRQEQELKYAGRTIGVDYADTDYAAVARAMGLKGERVTTLARLRECVTRALRSGDGPTLLDVPIDQRVNAWTYAPFLQHEPEDG